MRWRSTVCLLFFLCAGGVACNDDLPKPSLVDGLRVLGIQADVPEASPGDTVVLSALVVDTENRPVTLQWSACILPERGTGPLGGGGETGEGGGKGYGLNDGGTCMEMAAIDPGAVMDLGTGEQATLTIPADFLTQWANTARAYGLPADSPLPPEALAGLHAVAGVNLTVTLEVTAGEDVLVALKRVNVSIADEPNENPTGMAFHLVDSDTDEESPTNASEPADGTCLTDADGGLLTLYPGEFQLTALNAPENPVSYPVLTIGNTESFANILVVKETYYYSFFSTVGEFNERVVKSTGSRRTLWELSDDDVGETTLWIVTRDGRGGIGWCEQPIEVQAENPQP